MCLFIVRGSFEGLKIRLKSESAIPVIGIGQKDLYVNLDAKTRIMKKSFLALFLLLMVSRVFSQSATENESVMVPIKALFDGMRAGDSAMVHSGFAQQVTFVSVLKGKDGKPRLRPEALEAFLKAVGTAHKEIWNEQIWDAVIKVDGDFAQVWADYAFYTDKTFSHCGVDAFHLIKNSAGAWKIFHLADTRRVTGCEVPEKISNQFK